MFVCFYSFILYSYYETNPPEIDPILNWRWSGYCWGKGIVILKARLEAITVLLRKWYAFDVSKYLWWKAATTSLPHGVTHVTLVQNNMSGGLARTSHLRTSQNNHQKSFATTLTCPWAVTPQFVDIVLLVRTCRYRSRTKEHGTTHQPVSALLSTQNDCIQALKS